jgi:hypothetical protein
MNFYFIKKFKKKKKRKKKKFRTLKKNGTTEQKIKILFVLSYRVSSRSNHDLSFLSKGTWNAAYLMV